MIADRLRAAVLQAAISGKLTDQRPEDGTAADLLEQIAAERAQLEKEGKLKKQKPLPPINEADMTFKLPTGWEWARLGTLGELHTGKTPPSSLKGAFSGSTPFITPGDIEYSGKVNYDNRNLSKVGVSRSRPIPADSIVQVCIGGSAGKTALLDRICCFNQQINAIHLINNIKPAYIYWHLRSPFIQYQIEILKAGTATPIINKSRWSTFQISLPPLAEQERIVAKLEEILPLIDQLAELEREREHLDREFAKAIERAILQAAISGKLTEQLPEDGTATDLLEQIAAERAQLEKEGKLKKQKPLPSITEETSLFNISSSWAWVRLGDLTKYSGSGSTPKGGRAVYVHEGTMFLRSQNIRNEGLRIQDVAFISKKTVETLGSNTVYPGDILLNITGASIGRSAVVPIGFSPSKTNQHILTVRLVDSRIARYVQTVISSDFGFQQIMQRQNGGTKEGLNSYGALSLPLPLPPLAEQERIVAKLEEILPLVTGIKELVS